MRYTAYVTTASGERQTANGTFEEDVSGQENSLIKLYPDHTDQIWDGFGGAVTDSCAYVWSLMPPRAAREAAGRVLR